MLFLDFVVLVILFCVWWFCVISGCFWVFAVLLVVFGVLVFLVLVCNFDVLGFEFCCDFWVLVI